MKNVGQVMTTQVSWVGPDFTVPEIARRMRADDIGSVPVAYNDRLIGMVTDRDIVVRAVADGGEIERVTARQVMSASVLYCYDSDNVAAVLRNMGENQVRRRSEEHTSELQSQSNLVCRLLLEKKKKKK